LVDKTSIEGNNSTGAELKYDENNFLISSGVRLDGVFREATSQKFLDQNAFTNSVKDIYQYRATGYKEIRGAEKAKTMSDKLLLNMGYLPKYKSTKLLMNTYETTIEADYHRHRFVRINLSSNSADKAARMAQYNKYYDLVAGSTGSRWVAITDDGHADMKKPAYTYTLQNIFDKTKIIKLSFDGANGVSLELY